MDSLIFKLNILLLLHKKDEMFYTELWENLRDLTRSKATFNKYLRELERKNLINVSYRRVGRGVRAYYSLSDFMRKKFDETFQYVKNIVSNPQFLHEWLRYHVELGKSNNFSKIVKIKHLYLFVPLYLYTYILSYGDLSKIRTFNKGFKEAVNRQFISNFYEVIDEFIKLLT